MRCLTGTGQTRRLAATVEGNMLAIVWHSRTGASEQLAGACARGAARARPHQAFVLAAAHDVTADFLLAAAGYLFVCPENLGSMSGMMKEMFDRCYYPLLGQVEGRPYATVIAAGSDGSGAQAQLDRIVTGWRLRRVAEPFIVNMAAGSTEAILAPKQVAGRSIAAAEELGELMASGLGMHLF